MKKRCCEQMRDVNFENLMIFLKAVMAQDPERDVIEVMDCPVCGGSHSVQYMRSSYNGHFRARCSSCDMNFVQ